MLKKTCPWCLERATLNQLGRRPVQKNYKWYQFSRTLQVCPYCAGAVKLGGKAIWFMLLALPVVLSIVVEMFSGINLLESLGLAGIGWGLFWAGCLGAFYFSVFIKVE